MSRHCALVRRVARCAVVSLLVSLLAVTVLPTAANAVGTSLLTESFTNAALSNSSWSFPSGSSGVCLTAGTNTSAVPVPDCQSSGGDAPGSGALQLTNNAGNQVGTIFSESALSTTNGLDVTWNSYQFQGSGADGISFDLAAVDPTNPLPPTTTGPLGGSLGYAAKGSTPGMPYGYLGFGADVYGNYESNSFSGAGCSGSTPARAESLGVRGPGNGTTGYCLLAQSNLASGYSLDSKGTATRSTNIVVPEEVALNPSTSPVVASASGVTVPAGSWMFAVEPLNGGAPGTTWTSITGALPTNPTGVPSSWLDGSTGLPQELAFGWASSTGGSNEYHQINDLQASSFVASPILSLTNTDSGSGTLTTNSSSTVTLNAGVAAASTVDETQPITVSDTFPASLAPTSASGTGWTCSVTGQLVSCRYSGAPPSAGTALPPISVAVTVSATTGSFSDTAMASSTDAVSATATDSGPIVNLDVVSFNSEGGSAVSSISGPDGTTVTLPSAPTLAGYTFDGWFAAATGGSALTSPYTLSGSLTLDAQWTATPTDVVSFNSEGGSAVSSISGLDGTTVTLPSAPTLAGHTFDGWFAAATGGSALTSPYTLSGSLTLDAQWTAIVTGGGPKVNLDVVSFNSEGGSAVSSISGPDGTTVTLPSAPTLAGHTFDGWFAAATGGSALTSPYTLSGSLTLDAQWTAVVSPVSPKRVLKHASTTLYYANDSWNLSSKSRSQLVTLAQKIKSNHLTVVFVNGYASSTGTRFRNDVLGKSRARVAVSYLKVLLSRFRIRGVVIRAAGHGSSDFAVKPHRSALNRRTAIVAS